jgi:hypothetical protein
MSRQFDYTMQEKIVRGLGSVRLAIFFVRCMNEVERIVLILRKPETCGDTIRSGLNFCNDRKPGKYSFVFLPLIYKYVDAQLFQFCFHREINGFRDNED